MTEVSDPRLIAEVRQFGLFNARGCFSCGSCTLSCDLATDAAAFPRRTMQAVVLGLKDTVRQSLDPWLCHDCGDCSLTCPREARPRDSMMTLRRYLTAQYGLTGLARWMGRSAATEVVALALAALLVLALAAIYHLYYKSVGWDMIRSTPMPMEHMFPKIGYFTLGAFLLAAFFIVAHAARMFWFALWRGPGGPIPLGSYLAEAKTMFWQAASQRQMLKCPTAAHRRRWTMHWMLALGCGLMFAIKLFFLRWFQTDSIYGLEHPQRWLGYLCAALLSVASLDILVLRARRRGPVYKDSQPGDLILPALLLLTAVSGLAVHVLRYLEFGLSAHFTYALHLMIAAPLLVVELPFGRSSHMIYRPLALYFAAVRARALAGRAEQAVEEAKAA